MNQEHAIKYISNAMSLRIPQIKSLEIFANYLESESGQKLLARMKIKNRDNTAEILTETKQYFSSIPEAHEFSEFERAFPAYTFALATGVGKTRLMGAFVSYLYLVYNIQHFLIVAPNLTIYRKLYDDFSKSNNPKYVFRGIQEININTTKIITTENYANQRTKTLFGNQIEINIFNIQQFAQKDMTNERGITKMWETAGESYFDYLKSLDDLVVLLDETHHYHADASLGALDILDPIFALEMTATPYLGTKGSGKNAQQIRMKNVLYSYNLGDAIRGKLVKDPWIGTEADVDQKQFDNEDIETDARKLQLAIFFHNRVKNALKEYALVNNKQLVKPVLLVVAKDTDHAKELRKLIDSDDFARGEFKGKVLEIHTKLKGDEVDENIEKLISLEHPDNPIEIVIHVNMLKEGWDVANVYTIAPLRQSAAAILTEQTIGRGLRLPYGERTGVVLIDKLIIVAHEQFSKILTLAKDSPLIQGNVEQITEQEKKEIKIITEVKPNIFTDVENLYKQNEVVMQAISKQVDDEILNDFQLKNLDEFNRTKCFERKQTEKLNNLIKETIEFSANKKLKPMVPQDSNFELFLIATQSGILEKAKEIIKNKNILIPRVVLMPSSTELIIHEFDLDTNNGAMRYYTNEKTILEEQLQSNSEKDLFDEDLPGRRQTETTKIKSFGSNLRQSPQNTIIAAMLDYPLVDYDEQKTLLLKLADQTVAYYRKKAIDEDNLALIIESNAHTIAEDIYNQILKHKEYKTDGYENSDIYESKTCLENYNISNFEEEKIVSLESQVDTFQYKLIYGYFKKACHPKYRFDSADEIRLAYLLDRDESVKTWLRPAPNQFEGLYWRDENGDSQHRYEPDFVAELNDEIIIIEVKPSSEINDFNVQAKKKTAEKYCEVVSKNIGKFGIFKPWRYVIIPTERITINSTIESLVY